jgi:hypothetical protein
MIDCRMWAAARRVCRLQGYAEELLKLSMAYFLTCRMLQVALLRRLLKMKLGILISRFMVEFWLKEGQLMLVDECGLELHSSRSREQPMRGDMFASELQSRVVACIP